MFGTITATVVGCVLVFIGVFGCVVPVVPGPLLAAAALFGVSWAGAWEIYPWYALLGWSVAAVLAQLMDNILPARAAGKAGAGRGGVIGSVVGMLAGTLLLPPFGVFLGAFLGALAGEVLFHRENRAPIKSAIAVFRGTLGAVILKLAVTGTIAFVFARGAIQLF